MHVEKHMHREIMHDVRFLRSRKRWYHKAIEMATQWKTISKPGSTEIAGKSTAKLWKSVAKSPDFSTIDNRSTLWKTVTKSAPETSVTNPNRGKLRKCSSLRVATSFTRACLCAPISSYNEGFRADVQPRRSYSYPRTKQFPMPQQRIHNLPRVSAEGRRIFRGKSLRDNILMRRFVVEEEAMIQIRRRNQMEVIRKRNLMGRKKIGPSPLRRMVLAKDEEF